MLVPVQEQEFYQSSHIVKWLERYPDDYIAMTFIRDELQTHFAPTSLYRFERFKAELVQFRRAGEKMSPRRWQEYVKLRRDRENRDEFVRVLDVLWNIGDRKVQEDSAVARLQKPTYSSLVTLWSVPKLGRSV